jgi:hypothetical protein
MDQPPDACQLDEAGDDKDDSENGSCLQNLKRNILDFVMQNYRVPINGANFWDI